MNFFAGLLAGFIMFTETGKNLSNKMVDNITNNLKENYKKATEMTEETKSGLDYDK